MQDVAGTSGELREARKDMALQAAEMREMWDMTDEMMGHVEQLTIVFHQIDAEQKRGHVVHFNVAKSTPVHVQGTTSDLKEPAGHVQTRDVPLAKNPSTGTAQQRLFLVLKVVLHAVVVISEVLRLSTKSRCSRCCRAHL